MGRQEVERVAILSGWKDIASYLGKSVRTVQRYERIMGLPIHRPAGHLRGSVIAMKTELHGWVSSCLLRQELRVSREQRAAFAAVPEIITRSVVGGQRLCDRMRRLRQEVHNQRVLLEETIHLMNRNVSGEAALPCEAAVLPFQDLRRKLN